MMLCRVVGTVVATAKDPGFRGSKLLLVQRCDAEGRLSGDTFVANDTVGAGVGETVLISTGGSARATASTKDAPTDAAIVGIVDSIESSAAETRPAAATRRR